jgi:hypothetical protein
LCDEGPTVFQAFYDWLYSGQVREAEQYNGFVPSEIHWLRVYAIATCLEIEVLQNTTFSQIQASLGKEETRVANLEFIAGLFKGDVPNKRLERYIIHHCAFYLKAGEPADWKVWSRSLKADDRF